MSPKKHKRGKSPPRKQAPAPAPVPVPVPVPVPPAENMSYRDRLHEKRDDRREDRGDRREDRGDRRDARRDDRIERHETGITRWEQNALDGTGLGSGNTKDFFKDAAMAIGGELIGPFVGEITGIPELGGMASGMFDNWRNQPPKHTQTTFGGPNDTGGLPINGGHGACSCSRPPTNTPQSAADCEAKARQIGDKAAEKYIKECQQKVACAQIKKSATKAKCGLVKKKKATKKKTTKKKTAPKKRGPPKSGPNSRYPTKRPPKANGMMAQCFR